MKPTAVKLIAIFLVALLMPMTGAARAGDPLPADNDFILRAPVAEVDGIAARNGLTVISQVATAVDDDGHSIFLVRASSGASPELVISDVEEFEPGAAGIERAVLASLPKLDQSAALILDTSRVDQALAVEDRIRPPSGHISADWVAADADRQIEAEIKDLELVFENDAVVDPAQYGLAVNFEDGSSTAWDPTGFDPSCTAVFDFDASFSSSQAKFYVTNTGSSTITLSGLDLAWPNANGAVLEIKFGGDLIHLGATTSPADLDSGWLGSTQHREIDPGKTEEIKLEFELTPDTSPASYFVSATFAEGHAAAFDPADTLCPAVMFFQGVNIHNEKVEWELLSRDSVPRTVASLDVDWPEPNGLLLSVELKGKQLERETVREFGENLDGTPRYVWLPYIEQPATQLLELDDAQRTFRGDATVAIIDTGIDPNHALLADNIVPGYDFVNDVAGTASEWADLDQSAALILDQSAALILDQSAALILDQSAALILDQSAALILDTSTIPPAFGHGTMVAGIIHRVAPEAKIMPLKAFDSNGHAHLYDIVDAIYFAVNNGANVINMSFSLETFSPALMRAINYAARNGVACVASAGNKGEELLVFPASLGNTLGVASTNDVGELSGFSNWGSDLVTISAPGENIVTTYPGNRFAVASGTSFSAPWIAGASAIFADKLGTKHAPGLADYYLSSQALSNADQVSGSGSGKSGHGRANLKSAVDRVKSGRYTNTRPLGQYTLTATFAEGCTANYPPPSTPGTCTVEGASQLGFNGKKVVWSLENTGGSTVTLDSVTLVWEADNGNLKKLELDGDTIYDSLEHPPTSTSINSGWHQVGERRVIAPGETLELEVEFEENVIWTY